MTRVQFSELAREEFADAVLWYEGERPGLGHQFRTAVVDAAKQAAELPDAGSRVTDRIRRRRIPPFPHMLYYVVVNGNLLVIAVFHGRRDPRLLDERDS